MRGDRRRSLLVAVAVIAAALSLTAWATGILASPELATVDARFGLRGPQPTPQNLAVVGIDAQTFHDLRLQWPFPRSLEGTVIKDLARDGARLIVVDIQYTEPSTTAQDNALVEDMRQAGNVVLATADGQTNVLGGRQGLTYARATFGDAEFKPQLNGVIRELPYRINGLPSLAMAAADRLRGRVLAQSTIGGAQAWIDFYGPPRTVPEYPFSQVLEGHVAPDAFRGRVVVLGPVAPSLQDVHATSTSGSGALMSGAELQANAIGTVLAGAPLRPAPAIVAALIILFAAGIAPLAAIRLQPLLVLAVAGGVGGLYACAAQLSFNANLIVPVLAPLVALAVATVGTVAVQYTVEAFERQRTRDLFSRFVSDDVVAQVLERRESGSVQLAGVSVTTTVLFSDLRGFTSFSEDRDPEVVVAILNHYMAEMSDAILDHGGTLTAYMGDGIMAVFGAPIAQSDHADRALAAAREMLDRMIDFNLWVAERGHPSGFKMGIGLNTGVVVAGTVGSERRLDYTVIGDTTNTAARLEGMTKGTPHQLFVADATRAALQAEETGLQLAGEFEVRGRSAKLTVWTQVTESTVTETASLVDAVLGPEMAPSEPALSEPASSELAPPGDAAISAGAEFEAVEPV